MTGNCTNCGQLVVDSRESSVEFQDGIYRKGLFCCDNCYQEWKRNNLYLNHYSKCFKCYHEFPTKDAETVESDGKNYKFCTPNCKKEWEVQVAESGRAHKVWGISRLVFSVIFVVSAAPFAWHILSLWIAAWKTGAGNPKDWSMILASAGSSQLSSGVAVWTGITLYVIGLIGALKVTWRRFDERNEDNKTFHQLFAFVGSVILTVQFWGQVSDSRFHIAMVAACVILPFIPFVRICLASLGGGMAMAYVLIVPAWVLGWTAGSITGWFSTSHPVQSATLNTAKNLRNSGQYDGYY